MPYILVNSGDARSNLTLLEVKKSYSSQLGHVGITPLQEMG